MAADVAEYALALLKQSPAVTALVVDGATGILETGDSSPKTIADAEATRLRTGNPAKVLAITVQDAGEKAIDAQTTEQYVAIWIFDRERGYSNIRKATKAVYAALHGKSTPLTSPFTDRTVAVTLELEARTGHRIERSLEVDFELMTFKAIVKLDLG